MISVVLLMAGRGTRMGLNENKILLKLGDKPLFMYSLEKFLKHNFEVVCVINENDKDKIVPILPKNVKYVLGGKERGDSVLNGIRETTGDYLLIHDAARPFISDSLINEIIEKKKDNRCILAYLPVVDTIKENGNKLKTLDRSKLIKAVTPQAGPRMLLLNAYSKALIENRHFTDDISVVEHYFPNIIIDLVKANEEIFKVTTQYDLKIAEAIYGDFND